MKQNNFDKLLELAIKASIEAGKEIIKVYEGEFNVKIKDDNSPLTIADTKSNNIINSFLNKTNIPVLSEEGKAIPYELRKNWETFWIVDPLDGTKEFIKRNGEFTVNIALIKKNKPVMGVIYIPVQKCLYFGSEHTGSLKVENIKETESLSEYLMQGSKLPINTKNRIFTVVGSKSHMTKETEDYIEQLKKEHGRIKILSKGSSLKICMVAEGKANEYPRFAPTMEWDVAAGHAIVRFAGGMFLNYESNYEMTYNTETLLNPWFIVKSM